MAAEKMKRFLGLIVEQDYLKKGKWYACFFFFFNILSSKLYTLIWGAPIRIFSFC